MIRLFMFLILLCSGNTLVAQGHTRAVGNKSFELSNHLGNVLEVTTDRKVEKHTEAEIMALYDYYPYGVLMEGRHGQEKKNNYRYAFQGQEKNDGVEGKGNSYDFGARIYNSRIGRFNSIDPLITKYPHYSPYIISGNMLTNTIDAGGLEPIVRNGKVIGYRVEAGQGPSQIAADLNNPETRAEYGYTLQKKVNYKDIVLLNYETFTKNGNYEGKDWVDNPNDGGYSHLNINEGDDLLFSLTPTQKVDGATKAANSSVSASNQAVVRNNIRLNLIENKINGLLEPNWGMSDWEQDLNEAQELILSNMESFDEETKNQLIEKYNKQVDDLNNWNNLPVLSRSNPFQGKRNVIEPKIKKSKRQSKDNNDFEYGLEVKPTNQGSKTLKKSTDSVKKIINEKPTIILLKSN